MNLVGKYSTTNACVFVSHQDLLSVLHYLSLNSREVELLLNFVVQSTSFEGKSFDLVLYNNTFMVRNNTSPLDLTRSPESESAQLESVSFCL